MQVDNRRNVIYTFAIEKNSRSCKVWGRVFRGGTSPALPGTAPTLDAKRQESTGDEERVRYLSVLRGITSKRRDKLALDISWPLNSSARQDLFYTEGVEELLEARVKIAEWLGILCFGCVCFKATSL